MHPNADQQRVRLVLHADDLGMSPEVSGGIIRGFTHGLLTSASILANGPDFRSALNRWKELVAVHQAGGLPSRAARAALADFGGPLDLGVHLNLTQGRPLTGQCYPSCLLDGHSRFRRIEFLLAALAIRGRWLRRAVADELRAQIERVAADVTVLTHLNGHQYVEFVPVVGDLMLELASEFGICCVRVAREPGWWRALQASRSPKTHFLLGGVKAVLSRRLAPKMASAELRSPSAFFGANHAGRIDLSVCSEFLRTIGQLQRNGLLARQKESGLVEIAFHPGLPSTNGQQAAANDGWHDPLAALRPKEAEVLTSERFLSLLQAHAVRLSRLGESMSEWRVQSRTGVMSLRTDRNDGKRATIAG